MADIILFVYLVVLSIFSFWAIYSRIETRMTRLSPSTKISDDFLVDYNLQIDQLLLRDKISRSSWMEVFHSWCHDSRRLLESIPLLIISTILSDSSPKVGFLHTSIEHPAINGSPPHSGPPPDTLIILTTCNKIRMSILAVSYIHAALSSSTSPAADLVIVDDNSIDGTAEYFRRRGYYVISAPDKAMGLTYSWNAGYQFAVAHGYSYILFMNNDVLLPAGAIEVIREDLLDDAVVVPMTTGRGAGHNPIQSMAWALKLSHEISEYADNPRNLQGIQDILSAPSGTLIEALWSIHVNSSTYKNEARKNKDFPVKILSLWKNRPRFNGFTFGVNISAMASLHFKRRQGLSVHTVAESQGTSERSRDTLSDYQAPRNYTWEKHELFNASNRIIGQEDELSRRMINMGIRVPKVSLRSFLFHFKSQTVKAMAMSQFDSRENLTRYHPEMSHTGKYYEEGSRTFRVNSGYVCYFPADSNAACKKSEVIGSATRQSYKSEDELFCAGSETASSNGPVTLRYPIDDSTDKNFERIVVAFATSNPSRNPFAGDIFTAREIAVSLKRSFPQSLEDVVYLHKGLDWYDMVKLSRVDVLITLLDDYDLSRVLSPYMGLSSSSFPFGTRAVLSYGIQMSRSSNDTNAPGIISRHTSTESARLKPTFLAVAWARNWFSRWLSRPWLGNYDLILLSSQVALDYFAAYSKRTGGFSAMCTSFCPTGPLRTFALIRDALAPPSSSASLSSDISDPTSFPQTTEVPGSFRFQVPLAVLRIATNPRRFRPGPGTAKYRADYGFTGSYYKVHRQIQEFDPADVLSAGLKGLVIGSGWANSSDVSQAWKNISIGSLPYDQMPLVYQSLGAVIDDANHVTKPWGSVNSRVFDAIASGCLPITNGALGSADAFSSLLPVYHNASHLKFLLLQYGGENKTQSEARAKLTIKLREIVLANHTYDNRSLELASYLNRFFGLNLSASVSESEDDKTANNVRSGSKNPIETMCIGVRTYEAHRQTLELMLLSLASQFTLFKKSDRWKRMKSHFAMKLFIIETDATSPAFKTSLLNTIDRLNRVLNPGNEDRPSSSAAVFWDAATLSRKNKNPFYGYDSTDFLLQHMLFDTSSGSNSCDWIMFTNGDNLYNLAWVSSIADHLVDPSVDALAWDFVTHHPRSVSPCGSRDSITTTAPRLNGTKYRSLMGKSTVKSRSVLQGQQLVRVSFTRRFIDLGSAIVRKSLYINGKAKFLPEGMFTSDLFARDFHLLSRLVNSTTPARTRLIHRCLLFHQ